MLRIHNGILTLIYLAGALGFALPDDVSIELRDNLTRSKGLQFGHGRVTTLIFSLV